MGSKDRPQGKEGRPEGGPGGSLGTKDTGSVAHSFSDGKACGSCCEPERRVWNQRESSSGGRARAPVASSGGVGLVSPVSMRAGVMSAGPALAEFAPLHLRVINELLIDGMAIEVRDWLGISSRGNKSRIARAISWISSIAGISGATSAVAISVPLAPILVSAVSPLVS